ncbi:MAG: hypothetical protein H0Z28_00160 [Archaeoglobus sp.]|nr:hypothetical protein [Archaeoglobus sp.]
MNDKNIKLVWGTVLIWFLFSCIILFIAGEWRVVAFAVTYGIGYGGILFRYRETIRRFFLNKGIRNYRSFLLLAIAVTMVEETYCYILGNRTAHPVLWIDLILVSVMWTVWFSTWFLLLSRKYLFSEDEALLIASFTGVFYEFIGKNLNPVDILIAFPLVVVVYAAVFLLPMQLINFTGTQNKREKYVIGALLPFLLTLPVAIVLFTVLSFVGILV